MKNKFAILGIVLIIVIVSIFSFTNQENNINGNIVKGDTQVVKLYVENGKYILEPSKIKKGIPVIIEADMSKMPGCSKSIVIPSFNIRKNFNNENNTIEFIPNKAGTFNIACSMNMYQGTFVVLEDDGTKSDYIEKPLSKQSSCSMSGCGGCGK